MRVTLRDKIESILSDAVREVLQDSAELLPENIDISIPEKPEFGHFSTNVAMRMPRPSGSVSRADGGDNPFSRAEMIAAQVAKIAPRGFFEKVEAVRPGFINFRLSLNTVQDEFREIADKGFSLKDGSLRMDVRGRGNLDRRDNPRSFRSRRNRRRIIVEYSSPNIAKELNVGHLRNTFIGAALANIFEALGYDVVRWNYLGDWGTQFGKLIAAYKLWGNEKMIREAPVEELQKLYVKFHEEAKSSPELERRGQEEFKKLEDGDRGNRKLWKWFRAESVSELKRAYKTLGAEFDVWTGESFFNKDADRIASYLLKNKIAEPSDGAEIIKLDEFNLPPALIRKSDGATLYITRDIANLRYRLKKYKPEKILYVIGNEQSLQFEQLFAVAKKIGIVGDGMAWNKEAPAELLHIKYGLVLGEAGKKFSTREGRTVSAREIIGKAMDLARNIIEEKNSDLSRAEKENAAAAVAIGALKYFNLKENRATDIVFNWDEILSFTGDSAPYLQYTRARLLSIIRKAENGEADGGAGAKGKTLKKSKNLFDKGATSGNAAKLSSETELALMLKIFEFQDAVMAAAKSYSTSVLSNYIYRLAVAANRFYESTPAILKDEDMERRSARLALIVLAAVTLGDGLNLLGIETPEKI